MVIAANNRCHELALRELFFLYWAYSASSESQLEINSHCCFPHHTAGKIRGKNSVSFSW